MSSESDSGSMQGCLGPTVNVGRPGEAVNEALPQAQCSRHCAARHAGAGRLEMVDRSDAVRVPDGNGIGRGVSFCIVQPGRSLGFADNAHYVNKEI